MADNRSFISYRRDPGYPWARLIWDQLVDRGIDVFLDLESLRSAGLFDDRLLTQIASRPYFLVVLTQGTLDRCHEPGDWMTREVEYALEHGRVIVPIFIAPFEPSQFPRQVPTHVADSLHRSQGLTVYTQYLAAAMDKLAFELLTPVDLGSVEVTEEDDAFHDRAVEQIRSMPPPVVPTTPNPAQPVPAAPDPTDADLHEATSATTPSSPGPGPDAETPTDGLPTIVPATPDDSPAPTPVGTAPAPTSPADTAVMPGPGGAGGRTSADAPPTTTVPAADGGGRALTSGAPPVVPPRRDPRSSRAPLIVAGLLAAGVVAAGIGFALSGGDDPPPTTDPRDTATTVLDERDGTVHVETLGADVWLEPGHRVRSANGAHELVMTDDGRLQLRSGGEVVWAPDYDPVDTASAVFQRDDGNFVVYRRASASSGALWASNTQRIGPGGSLRVVDEDGNGHVVISDADGIERWREPPAPAPDIDPTAAAAVALDELVAADRPTVDAAIGANGGWLVQMGAKRIEVRDGVAWDHALILEDHRRIRDESDAVIVDGAAYNLNLAGFWVTMSADTFDSKEAAQDWCRANRPGDCGVKFVSPDPSVSTQAWFDVRE